ncbi:Fpg/Nei family DNA glycosylase [Corynebacterium kozikiae]|uniref:Fpg/Nei family DNA glycosylase n=1 Tax=Corynebacterium kozikiae TaxID=2968469 RepID=UPI00211BA7B2|nr:DNA-formamidopyrimidine glycosylase family protein [Corynebacterium sp. 76QC2CO]MCQ9343792.1 Fpg/Nei family DNA glycosylase [Corynebacterium sp. 76QC2CO]
MPEGHVIHRLARDINTAFSGGAVQVRSPQGRFAAEAARLDGSELVAARAHGKHLFVEFDVPLPERFVYVHLGLIGSWRFEPPHEQWGQIRLQIANATVAANLRGPQFCRLLDADAVAGIVGKLGADPLLPFDPHTYAAVEAKVKRSRRSIGSLLMDQKLFPGVGNIYRAETLFRLGISPFTPGFHVKLRPIWDDLVLLMDQGVESGRIDTVRPEHTPEAMGRAPRKDDHGGEVYVYRRAGQPCYVCGTPIAMQVMEGRNLFWCPSCQE